MNARQGRAAIHPLAAVAIALAALAACGDDDSDAVRGSGTLVTEQREVAGFSEEDLRGSGEVAITVGTSESLTIEADDNVLPLISTDVRGSTLVIEHDEPISPSAAIVYRIEAIEFEGVAVAGSADVVAPNIECGTFSVSVAGAGSLDLDGRCDVLDVEIAGSGDLDAEGLGVERAAVSIAGSGDVLVNVREALEVSISGSGDVVYLGDPETDVDIQGSGAVRPRP